MVVMSNILELLLLLNIKCFFKVAWFSAIQNYSWVWLWKKRGKSL